MIVHSDNDVLSHVICKQVFLVTMCRKEPRPWGPYPLSLIFLSMQPLSPFCNRTFM